LDPKKKEREFKKTRTISRRNEEILLIEFKISYLAYEDGEEQ